MRRCKNCTKCKYSGNEPSPKGLGICACPFRENYKEKGKDNNIWVVKLFSNRNKRWVELIYS